jgi:hypothetical protein
MSEFTLFFIVYKDYSCFQRKRQVVVTPKKSFIEEIIGFELKEVKISLN